jgi:putative ABC transport system ATP-binding protein
VIYKNHKPVISVADLSFAYQPNDRAVLTISRWQVEPGERVFLFGESGSGKSTLLNLLAGLLMANQGAINIQGTDLSRLTARQRDRFRASQIGLVLQQFNLVPYLSVLDNIILASHFARQKTSAVMSRAHQLLAEVNLTPELLTRPAHQLSMGQQQRVAIVRALINSPPLLLVDEPTSALDGKNRDAFMSILFALLDLHRSTLIFVSHDQSLARSFAQQLDLTSLNTAGGNDTNPHK